MIDRTTSRTAGRTIAELVAQLRSLDIQLLIEDDAASDKTSPDNIRLRCSAPTGTLTPELRQELADRKAELISYLRSQATSSVQSAQETVFPLSFAQQRLWFLYQLAPDNPFYNVPAAIRLIGKLDQIALERSFNAIARRHATLRTHFTMRDNQPAQVVAPNIEVKLSVVDLQTIPINERERVSQQLATAEAQHPFNLETDPLLRVTLLQFDATEAVLLLTMHHIVSDGWSLGVLIRELADCYRAFIEGRSPDLSPLPIQYSDFACWQRQWLQGDVLEQQLAYWRIQLQDLPVLNLPSDRPRPAVPSYRGATCPLQLSPLLTQQLTALSQQSGASLFMTLLAAFQTLLYRYTGQDDIAVGVPIANRHRSEIEGLIGFFVNSLVMRSRSVIAGEPNLSGDLTFHELLNRMRNIALEAYAHQDLPFERLVEELEPERDPSRNPLFQVAFALQNAPMQSLELPELTLEAAPLPLSSTRFDLEVHLWEPAHGLHSIWQSQAGLSGFVAYSTDLFDADRIARLVGHFQTLLAGIVANPDARLADLPLLTVAEQQTLDQWNCSSPALLNQEKPTPELFHHIFEAQVQDAPDAVAIVSEQESLTYAELNQRADRLAQLLRQMGVQVGCLVGLCVDRSVDMVIGILGILKVGAAYVPLDPSYPRERLQFMLSDTQVAVLLTQSWLVSSLPSLSAELLCLDQLPSQSTLLPLQRREDLEDTTDSLAYVIYTSGSTGTPKGVLLSHRGLCNVVEAQRRVFQPCRSSRVLQFSSLSFDASIFEVALALGSGGTLYIPPKLAQLPGMALVQFLEANAITHALLTPAVLAVLPIVELPALQVLITGGEACSSQVVDRWAVNRRFFNAYGPTEVTIWATVAELDPGDNPLTIGYPISNTQVYILDDYLNPVPVGIPGELYIGGVGLARGYLNRPELTAERFIQAKGRTLYKTGDRALFRNDGTIEFLGRVDQQIKIRGFRVELGEIEATLQRHPAIQDAAVLACGEANDIRLIAYFSLDRQQFRQAQQSLQAQQIQQWQILYNQTYHSDDSIQSSIQISSPLNSEQNSAVAPSIQSAQFNITGWNSSYTGEPIPPEQMQEWVSDRVEQILALQPKRVLEIGCGTGLLLFQIAPHCQTYVATDFSTAALDSIQSQLNRLELPQVELLHRMATDLEGIQPASFDVVILNSIVQYFPSVDYLMQVLEQVISRVAPAGVLFVGDVRNLPLLTAFHTWMHFCRADADMERDQLQQQAERSRFEEPELVIDPAFFHALCSKFPRIQQVQIRLSRGHAENEMTQFRYNVLLHFDKPLSQPLESIQQHDWKLNPVTSKEIKNTLVETKPAILTIKNIKNCRVNAAVKAANWLQNQEAPKTVGRMRELLQNSEMVNSSDLVCGIDPQRWWDLETALPYRVEITWSAETHTGDYDVMLIRHDVTSEVNLSIFQQLQQLDHHCIYCYTNEPLQSEFARQLIPQLRQHLGQTLPDYMLPAAFVPLESLPLTASGKVNRRALPLFDRELTHPFPVSTATASTALSPIEVTLIEIWKDLLRLKQVNIYENFFELGGHSLLATQMTSRVRDALGLELPLQSVFTAPTIAQLAPVLETLSYTPSTSPPPLVRLDRTAYRRKQTALASTVESVESVESVNQTEPLPTLPPNQELEQASAQFAASRSPLVPLTLADSRQPFFCVHPMFGVVFPYLELAHQLDSSRSFYGLQPLGLDGKQPPLTEIEAMAAYYIRAIQTLQPQGPYFLGGWSFGGLVAFEMAQQLTQAGQEIALLAILDTPAPQRQPSFFQTLKFLLGTALWSTLPFLLDFGAIATQQIPTWKPWMVRWQWSEILRRLPQESQLRLLDESAIPALLRIVYANSQAAYRYAPQPYPDRLTLFRAAESIVPNVTESEASLGWRELAGEIQVHQVPGNHLSLLKQPHVQTLAQQLRPYLS